MQPIRTLAFALALSLPAATALAQRPQSPAMTCRQAASLVFARGAVVLGTGGHTYDRYVRDRGFCEVTESTKPGYAPTLDNPQCSSATAASSRADGCGTTEPDHG
ncbi:MAG: hypothetical protein ACJ8DL_01410 [Microvirga sp.]